MKAITIKDNEAFLRQISKPVDLNDPTLHQDIAILEEFCLQNEVMAMAAIQLGILKRLVYIKNTNLDLIDKLQFNQLSEKQKNYNEARVLINPVIISKEGLTQYYEACASCNDSIGLVQRPYRIEVQYDDMNGENHQETFIGFEATVLSHEMDHLDGILHIDIANPLYQMSREKRKKFRQDHPYEILSKTGDYEKLKQEIK